MTGNILLTGIMGAGKSTVGRILAEKLNFTFVDLDKKIEEIAGKSIPSIFSNDGEEAFRDLESATLKSLIDATNIVIATGGGAPVRAENQETMRQIGQIIWLDVSPDIAAARTRQSDRPLLQTKNPEKKLAALLNARRSAYEQCDLQIDGGLDPDLLSNEILTRL